MPFCSLIKQVIDASAEENGREWGCKRMNATLLLLGMKLMNLAWYDFWHLALKN